MASEHLSYSEFSDEEPPARPAGESVKRTASLLTFLGVCIQSLGGIYGDIGTSPLYTYSSIFTSAPSEKDILGATSCIFYSFTIVVLFKYCLFVFRYGANQGQGGAVAVYAKLAKKLNIAPRGVEVPNYSPKEAEEDYDDGVLTLELAETRASFYQKHTGKGISTEKLRKYFSWIPLALTFASTGLIMADGLLTPTTSVLSAVGGIAIPAPQVGHRVVLISCIILVVLFLTQRFGSSKISFIFGPIIFIWMIAILGVGIYNITFHPGIFKAFSPKFAIDFLKEQGIDGMGAVILPITGTETIFADLGHYSVASVTVTLVFFVYPCLILAYFGQAARLAQNPQLYANVFYRTIPGSGADGTSGGGIYWVVFVLATLATIIASQAVILGVSSMYMQLEHLDCVPKLHTVHISRNAVGKIYIPFVNYVMMILVVLTTIGFQNSNRVTNAYGLCIAMTFFFTTCLIAIAMKTCYNINIVFCLLFLVTFGTLDMCFTVAGLRKIKNGAWFPLMVSILVVMFMVFWRWGRSIQIDHEFKTRVPLTQILYKGPPTAKGPVLDLNSKTLYRTAVTGESLDEEKDQDQLYAAGTNEHLKIARLPGMAIFHANAYYTANSPNTVPQIFSQFVRDFPAVHQWFVFLAVRVTNAPFVQASERLIVSPMSSSAPGFFRAMARFGFMDSVAFDQEFINLLQARVKELEKRRNIGATSGSSVHSGHNRQAAQQKSTVHVFGYENLHGAQSVKKVTKFGKSVWWVRDSLISYLFTPIETVCRSQQSEGHVVEESGYHQGVFTISKSAEV